MVYVIKYLNSAYTDISVIPDDKWLIWGNAKTLTGANRHYKKAYEFFHKDFGCWTGHVRVFKYDIDITDSIGWFNE